MRESSFQLLTQRRFLPIFVTQFLGAFNDNVFKNALVVLLVFNSSQSDQTDILVNLAAGLFILPFFLFSATAGQLADKYDKSVMMRYIKMAEVVIMLLGSIALFMGNVAMQLGILFLMGTQSTFFGPIKYAILPQKLNDTELVAGNAQIEMGTFMAILLGTVLGGLLAGKTDPIPYLAASLMTISLLGYLASRAVTATPPAAADLDIEWNPFRSIQQTIQPIRHNDTLLHAIIGNSWFWFLGAAYLTQIPNYTQSILNGDHTVVTLLLCTFTIGIALGSIICERLSGDQVEIGLVPLGSIGLSAFGIHLFLSTSTWQSAQIIDWAAMISTGWPILLDFLFIGVFGGFYIVPLYAMIQARSEASQRARTISVNNISNALFMVASALAGMLCLGVAGLSISEFLLILSLMNIVVALYIYAKVPEFSMRFMVWLLSHTMYRVKHQNLETIPEQGGAIIVCNHVSYVDSLLLAGAVRRPIRFIMYKPIYDIPILNFVFRTGRAIPIISQHADQEAYAAAMDEIAAGLEAGDLLCIFPEGKLTQTGQINEFKTGIERIVERTPVPVIPMALKGLWGSFFSHRDGHAFTTLPKRFWSRIEICAGALNPPQDICATQLWQQVSQLRGDSK